MVGKEGNGVRKEGYWEGRVWLGKKGYDREVGTEQLSARTDWFLRKSTLNLPEV